VIRYIGPPLIHGFQEMLRAAGLDPARAPECVSTFRRHYGTASLARTTTFPGIRDAVERLSSIANLALVTSKLEVFARPLLASLEVDRWIHDVFSPPPAADDEPKTATLARAIETMNRGGGPVVMVGDRSHDVVAAIANDAVPVGVLWGFGSRDELTAAGATLMAETPKDLVPMVEKVLAAG
jgi:phosphoglycolate phosphatase